MAQGPQRCFLVPLDGGSHPHDLVTRRQVPAVPANTRLQLARGQAASALPKPVPVRVAITKPTTAEQPRLKHTAVAPVPVADVHRRKAVKSFDEIWPNWRVPAGIRTPYSPTLTKMLGAMAMGEVVGSDVGLVLATSAWQTQKGDKTGCFRTCLRMIKKSNSDAPASAGVSMVVEKDKQLIKTANYQLGLDVINSYLDRGDPIIVGVNIKWGHPGNKDNTTDHFVVIVARGNDKLGSYFRFFDPGAWNATAGTSLNNKLYYEDKSHFYKGDSQYHLNHNRHTPYILTWVRKMK